MISAMALKQHKTSHNNQINRRGNTSMGPLSYQNVTQNVRNTANVVRVGQQVQNIMGSDLLGPVIVKGGPLGPAASDHIIASWDLTPSGFDGTRLSQLAPLWERYRFKKLDLQFVTAVPTSMACDLIMFIDTDPRDDESGFSTPLELLRAATSALGSHRWNFNRNQTVPLIIRVDDQFYYTGVTGLTQAMRRQTIQGKAYLIQVTECVNFNGDVVAGDRTAGTCYIDWHVEFDTPQKEPTAATPVPPVPGLGLSFETAYEDQISGGGEEDLATGEFVSIGSFVSDRNGLVFASIKSSGNGFIQAPPVPDGSISVRAALQLGGTWRAFGSEVFALETTGSLSDWQVHSCWDTELENAPAVSVGETVGIGYYANYFGSPGAVAKVSTGDYSVKAVIAYPVIVTP